MRPDEVAPDIWRLPIPMPDNRMGTVNVYALALESGWALIDCGWDTPEAHAALHAQLDALGIGMGDVRQILVTHIHPDHFGMVQRLTAESGAVMLMHRLDAEYIGARYEHTVALVEAMERWLRLNGVPPDELEPMTRGSMSMLRRVGVRRPDIVLEGGETLRWGRYHFQVIWTPGHSSGLICLYDRGAELLLSSDHVLQRISPFVGLHTQSGEDPLRDYLDSLRRVRDLPVRRVLPGHGRPFTGLAERVDQIVRHHQDRLENMMALLDGEARTAYDLAMLLPWRGSPDGWANLEPFQRRMALTETLAHLEFLAREERIERHRDGDVVEYSAEA